MSRAMENYLLDQMEAEQDRRLEEKRVCKVVNGCHTSFTNNPSEETLEAVSQMIEKVKDNYTKQNMQK